jgi:hypothetical protein
MRFISWNGLSPAASAFGLVFGGRGTLVRRRASGRRRGASGWGGRAGRSGGRVTYPSCSTIRGTALVALVGLGGCAGDSEQPEARTKEEAITPGLATLCDAVAESETACYGRAVSPNATCIKRYAYCQPSDLNTWTNHFRCVERACRKDPTSADDACPIVTEGLSWDCGPGGPDGAPD